MVNIIASPNCGNSPKKQRLKELNIAFAERNNDFIAEHISDDITWRVVGDIQVQGKKEFIAALENMRQAQPTALEILNVITHGKEGAVNGELTLADGKKYAYCDVYEFSGAQKGASIKSITSYVLDVTAAT